MIFIIFEDAKGKPFTSFIDGKTSEQNRREHKKMDVQSMVTERIIAQLEKGIIPWKKPWGISKSGKRDGAFSHVTGKPYSLMNQILLPLSGEWLTFNEAKKEGGNVIKGSKASFVVFWKLFPKTETDEKGREKNVMIPFLRYYNVFHVSQCENINPRFKREEQEESTIKPHEHAEGISRTYINREKITMHDSGLSNRAFYSPSDDAITVPALSQFSEISEYYSTKFHEIVHSTGHSSRLARLDKKAAFGSEDYSKEELVAEIGASALVSHCGIESASSFSNNVAYIQSWLSALQNDKNMIVSAASRAEKAVKFILDEKEGEEQEQTEE